MAGLTKYDKEKTVTHPFSNYTVVMFVQGYVTVFLGLCDLGRKGPLQGCHTLWCSLGTRKCLLVGVTKISKEVVFIHERPNDLISIRTTYTR